MGCAKGMRATAPLPVFTALRECVQRPNGEPCAVGPCCRSVSRRLTNACRKADCARRSARSRRWRQWRDRRCDGGIVHRGNRRAGPGPVVRSASGSLRARHPQAGLLPDRAIYVDAAEERVIRRTPHLMRRRRKRSRPRADERCQLPKEAVVGGLRPRFRP